MSSLSADEKQALDTLAVNNFCEYLRIPSVHPNVNYGKLIIIALEHFSKNLVVHSVLKYMFIFVIGSQKCVVVCHLFEVFFTGLASLFWVWSLFNNSEVFP